VIEYAISLYDQFNPSGNCFQQLLPCFVEGTHLTKMIIARAVNQVGRFRGGSRHVVCLARSLVAAHPLVLAPVCIPSISSARSFHCSAPAAAKAKKGGKGKGDNDDEEGGQLPEIGPTKQKMEQVVQRFADEVSKLKVGRASVDMFDGIMVGSYGSVSSAGQVSVKTANTVSVAVYDPSMVKTVADAIKDCGMGFNPTIENSNVTVFVPKPSKESREQMVKAASKSAEKVRCVLRNCGEGCGFRHQRV
jgi:hypothetical protein